MDFEELQKQYDSMDMFSNMERFIDDFDKAFTTGFTAKIPPELKKAKHIVGLGMGGSGMGYSLLQYLARDFGEASIEVVSDYHLPPYVTKESGTVVCATSFSGNTEETLEGVKQAKERGVPIICVTTGGKLAAWAKENGATLITFEYPVPLPRVGLAFTFGIVLGVLCQAEILKPGTSPYDLVKDDFPNLKRYFSVEEAKKMGREIASKVQNKLIYVIGSGFSYAVAVRWKGQFNENSKTIAFAEPMPEMCHNEYLGYRLPENIRTNSAVIFLDSTYDHPQNQKRNRLVGEDLANTGVEVIHPELDSNLTPLSILIAQIMVGDWASYYLSLLNHVDPNDTGRIEELKKRL